MSNNYTHRDLLVNTYHDKQSNLLNQKLRKETFYLQFLAAKPSF